MESSSEKKKFQIFKFVGSNTVTFLELYEVQELSRYYDQNMYSICTESNYFV